MLNKKWMGVNNIHWFKGEIKKNKAFQKRTLNKNPKSKEKWLNPKSKRKKKKGKITFQY
jgi:uncharacterized protein YodC (DUF2158 family)